jgi:hypothetical protein
MSDNINSYFIGHFKKYSLCISYFLKKNIYRFDENKSFFLPEEQLPNKIQFPNEIKNCPNCSKEEVNNPNYDGSYNKYIKYRSDDPWCNPDFSSFFVVYYVVNI